MKSALFVAAGALCVGTSAAFTTAPSGAGVRPATSLSMAKDVDNNGKTFAASALAAAYLLTGVVSADAAFAMDGPSAPAFSDSSSVMISARSGGRAGGRSMARPAARPAASTTKVINQRTTVIAPPPVVVGGGYGYGGYGGYYDPTPGIALNLGFSAVNAVGNGMREARQNEMIAQERAELQASRDREAEMSARLRQLEMMQMQQGGAGGQAQPQVIIAQPPVQAAPAQQ